MKNYNIAVYIRLSVADEDTGKSKSESDIIANQRKLINRFLDGSKELAKCPKSEFCDDGYSGTNMERPAFSDMLERVKRGEFNLICVKDFSRFSRDYIEIGDMLECLFPFLGVRFISVNDGYDSDDYKGTTGGMDVVMRNIVYAAYSRDLSVKTTTAKIQLMKQGKYVGGYAPYGLAFHSTQRGKLVADPNSAEVVRRIFELAVEGKGVSEIAKILNAASIPTPGQYFAANHPDSKKFSGMSSKMRWDYRTVYNMLTKRVYTGAAVGHMRKTAVPLSRKTVKQDEADWIVVENAHEPIVSKADFEAAQAVMRKLPVSKPRTNNMYPLRSLVQCRNCGRVMARSRDCKYFYCRYGKYYENSGCAAVRYAVHELEEIVFNAIQMFLQTAGNRLAKPKTDASGNLKILAELQRQAHKLQGQKLELYERYSGGEISKQAYLERKNVLSEKLAETEKSISELKNAMCRREAPATELERAVHEFAGTDKLTHELAHAFVNAVLVSPDGHIELEWKFGDVAKQDTL